MFLILSVKFRYLRLDSRHVVQKTNIITFYLRSYRPQWATTISWIQIIEVLFIRTERETIFVPYLYRKMDGIHLDFREKSFVWAIYNFPILPRSKDEPVCSPEFSIDSSGQSQFYLQFHAKSRRERDKKDPVSICIARCSSDYGPKNVFLKYEISVLGAKQQPTK